MRIEGLGPVTTDGAHAGKASPPCNAGMAPHRSPCVLDMRRLSL